MTQDEYEGLEKSLIDEGCRDAIVLWEGIIVDGYNRYEICQRHGIEFKTLTMEFDNREDVINWIVDNQLGRRNLTPEQKRYLLGKKYKIEKQPHGGNRASREQNVPLKKTAEKIAEEHKVTHTTVKRAEKFADAVDTISDIVDDNVRSEILNKELNATVNDVQILARELPEVQAEVIAEARETKEPVRIAIEKVRGRTSKPVFNATNEKIEWAKWTWNPVTGCLHNCPYCLSGDTLITMSNGAQKPLSDIKIGDTVIGTTDIKLYRKYTTTVVLAHWETEKEAYQITLANGISIIASGDHRFLSERGKWKYVTGKQQGKNRRPHLTTNNRMCGIDIEAQTSYKTIDYKRGVKTFANLSVIDIKPLNKIMPMFDITTRTGDFIANGVISHNCYAREIANRFYPQKFEPTFHPDRLSAQQNTVIPDSRKNEPGIHNVFVCSMADLFGKWVQREWIDAVLDAVREAPDWNFLFLTKNPVRYLDFEFPANCWLGATADTQKRMDNALDVFSRIALYKSRPAVAFVSCEPLLEKVVIDEKMGAYIDWLIIGGKSVTGKPPEQPKWAWVEALLVGARRHNIGVYFKPNLTVVPKEYPDGAFL